MKFELSAVEKYPQTTTMDAVKEIKGATREEPMDTAHAADSHSQEEVKETDFGAGEAEEGEKAVAEEEAEAEEVRI